MGISLVVHVATGLTGLTAGFTAMGAAKGGTLHRRSGMLFVYSMIIMSLLGATIAAVEVSLGVHNPALPTTVLMGLLTAYLVVTALTTVRPPSAWSRRLDMPAMLLAAGIGIADLTLGTRALIDPDSQQVAILTVVEFIFGSIALVAAGSDLLIIRSTPLTGAKRIARHLWRMLLALWIAAFSFFPRLTRFVPIPLRPLISAPMIVVLIALAYWMWRVRFRKSLRRLGGVVTSAPSVS